MRWIPTGTICAGGCRSWIRRSMSPTRLNTSGLSKASGETVFAVEHNGTFCGLAGFRDTDRSVYRTEIGYWLIPPFRGRGIMRRCVRALCRYAFDSMDVDKVVIRCAVENRKKRDDSFLRSDSKCAASNLVANCLPAAGPT
ncbi:MAG: GNAT family N-acetyltransferase [Alistipes putredinis]|nr:MAG: GNAT family N-acetyltransferase [Alistipes putredinis]